MAIQLVDYPNGTSPFDTTIYGRAAGDGSVIKDTMAPIELRMVSQALDTPIANLLHYAYKNQAGGGVDIYIIDSGASVNTNPVSVPLSKLVK